MNIKILRQRFPGKKHGKIRIIYIVLVVLAKLVKLGKTESGKVEQNAFTLTVRRNTRVSNFGSGGILLDSNLELHRLFWGPGIGTKMI